MARYNLSIPADLKRRAKIKAAQQGIDLNEVVNGLIESWVDGDLDDERPGGENE